MKIQNYKTKTLKPPIYIQTSIPTFKLQTYNDANVHVQFHKKLMKNYTQIIKIMKIKPIYED